MTATARGFRKVVKIVSHRKQCFIPNTKWHKLSIYVGWCVERRSVGPSNNHFIGRKFEWKVKVWCMNDGAKSVILARNLCLHDITNLPGATTYLLSSNLLFWSI